MYGAPSCEVGEAAAVWGLLSEIAKHSFIDSSSLAVPNNVKPSGPLCPPILPAAAPRSTEDGYQPVVVARGRWPLLG